MLDRISFSGYRHVAVAKIPTSRGIRITPEYLNCKHKLRTQSANTLLAKQHQQLRENWCRSGDVLRNPE